MKRLGFLTVTTADTCRETVEFQRRWHSFLTGWVRRRFRSGIWVRQRQSRTGNWHMHALVDVGFDIQTGFPWAEVKARKYRNVSPQLRSLWKELREKAALYGFGRTELMPIHEPSERLFGYLTYYLTRGNAAARK